MVTMVAIGKLIVATAVATVVTTRWPHLLIDVTVLSKLTCFQFMLGSGVCLKNTHQSITAFNSLRRVLSIDATRLPTKSWKRPGQGARTSEGT